MQTAYHQPITALPTPTVVGVGRELVGALWLLGGYRFLTFPRGGRKGIDEGGNVVLTFIKRGQDFFFVSLHPEKEKGDKEK